MLRNARVLDRKIRPTWWCAGAAFDQREEYEYTKKVGYELGLRGLDVCTGCGPGAMKGPMKGATIGHAKQRISPTAGTSASPSPASSRPSRRTRSSTSW
jgi:predicted Rossmann-fold nucleotide-binding protein